MENTVIKVNAQYSADIRVVKKWLKELEEYSIIACDFEAAIKYTPEQVKFLTSIRDSPNTSFLEQKFAASVLKADALDHPAHVKITHFSVAWSDSDAYVIIMESDEVTNAVLDFLITTEKKQVWHNASYDFRLIYYATGKFPKNYEDSQIFAKTVFNHVEVFKARVGLKELAGTVYGSWGIVENDFFTLANLHDPRMLHYAATDACATFWVYDRLTKTFEDEGVVYPSTMDDYTPWEQLPAPNPMTAKYPEAHFYHHTAKFLVRDTVRIMMNGLPIDLNEVKLLEDKLETILDEVQSRLNNNPAVQRYITSRHESMIEAYKKVQRSKVKSPNDFLVPFSSKKVVHRCFFMDVFADKVGLKKPEEKLAQGCSKWSVKLIRQFVAKYPPLKTLLDHKVSPDSPTALEAITRLAINAADKHNDKYLSLIKTPPISRPEFNASSPKQKQELFSFLGYASDKTSKTTGEDSWDREQIEHLNSISVDEDIIELTQAFIDHSFSAIVKNNFVSAFYRYTLEGALYGQYKLLGAKSGRFTSSKPNMLNTPSSKSIFAKPVKKCFTAPPGFVVGAIDYAALEDRVMGNLSGDVNKKGVFLQGIDGHSLASVYYFPKEVQAIIGPYTDSRAAALLFKDAVDNKNAEAKAIRDRSKPISFGLAYGAYPPKVAASVKISLAEATALFNAYHQELYPGVTAYRENYVLKTAQDQGYIHLGLGFRMYTDNPEADIRTLNNGTCQFWSILTILAINRLHSLIDKKGYHNDVFVTSTIYDSIYLIIRDDPIIIKWVNDNLVPIMEKDFMLDQDVENSADLEIGPDWSVLYKLEHNASVQDIITVRGQWT